MWKYITLKSIQRRFARSRKTRKQRFVPYREASTIVVLTDGPDARQALHALEAMVRDGKRVVWYHFTPAAQSESPLAAPVSGIETVTLSLADLHRGNTCPRPEILRTFEALPADVLLDLTLDDPLPVAYLAARSQAPMRLGLQKNALVPADIMLQLEPGKTTVGDLLQNMLFYWKNIAAKNNNS